MPVVVTLCFSQRSLLNLAPWGEMLDRGICSIMAKNFNQFHFLRGYEQGKEEIED